VRVENGIYRHRTSDRSNSKKSLKQAEEFWENIKSLRNKDESYINY